MLALSVRAPPIMVVSVVKSVKTFSVVTASVVAETIVAATVVTAVDATAAVANVSLVDLKMVRVVEKRGTTFDVMTFLH